MDVLKAYTIPFAGLKAGMHHFDFELDPTFFEQFAASEIQEATVQVTTELDRRENMLVFQHALRGSFATVCDRCGEALTLPVEGDFELVVKFGPERGHSDEEILILGPSDYEVELAQYLYEYAHLALPSRSVHPEDGCDPKMLDLLDEHALWEPEESEEAPSDPRWDALKKLKGEDE